MPKVDDIYGSGDYLKAADLIVNGQKKKVALTIEGWQVEKFERDGREDQKIVLSFVGKGKKLVVNKTNAKRIEGHHGADLDGWKGKTIKVYATTTDFGGSEVDCLRVEEYIPPVESEEDDSFTI